MQTVATYAMWKENAKVSLNEYEEKQSTKLFNTYGGWKQHNHSVTSRSV